MSFVLNYSVLEKMIITAENIVREVSGLSIPRINYEIGTMKNQAGKAIIELNKVILSKVVLSHMGEKKAMNTLIHEIFHILTPTHGHTRNWKCLAMRFNCSQYVTEYGEIVRCFKPNDQLNEHIRNNWWYNTKR